MNGLVAAALVLGGMCGRIAIEFALGRPSRRVIWESVPDGTVKGPRQSAPVSSPGAAPAAVSTSLRVQEPRHATSETGPKRPEGNSAPQEAVAPASVNAVVALPQVEGLSAAITKAYEDTGLGEVYLKAYGEQLCCPLGWAMSGLESKASELRGTRSALPQLPTESYSASMRRLSAVHRLTEERTQRLAGLLGSCQVVCFKIDGRLEVLTGRERGLPSASAKDLVMLACGQSGKQVAALSEQQRLAVHERVADYVRVVETKRREMWSELTRLSADRETENVVAAVVRGGVLFTWREGECPELDVLLGEYQEMAKTMRANVERTLRE